MRIPAWLILGFAVVIVVFGAYRVSLAFRAEQPTDDDEARPRRGLRAMKRRTHLLVGVIYMLLGAGLVATTYGWNPLAR